MHPTFAERVLGFSVGSYSFFAAVGLVVGVVIALRGGEKDGLDRRRLVDLVLWVLVASLIGSKLAFYLVEWRDYVEQPWTSVDLFGHLQRLPRLLAPWQGGLVYYGGLLAGFGAAVIYLRRRGGREIGRSLDVAVQGLALGHVWGKLGCFLAGCCFGKAGGGPFGVSFPEGSVAFERHAEHGLLPVAQDTTYPLHPVQLYEAAVELVISGVLIFIIAPRRRNAGQLALTYLLLYSATRFVLEFYRGDRDRGFLGTPDVFVSFNRLIGVDGGSPTVLSVSQLIAVVVCLGAGFIWLLVSQRSRRTGRGSVTKRDKNRN